MNKFTFISANIEKHLPEANASEIIYICPDCLRIAKFKVNKLEVDLECSFENIQLESCSLNTVIRCVDCDSYMFQCDKEMVDIVRCLNSCDGVSTLYCCQGHVEYVYNPFTKGDRNIRIDSPYIVITVADKYKQDSIRTILSLANKSCIEYYEESVEHDEFCRKFTIRSLIHSEKLLKIENLEVKYNLLKNQLNRSKVEFIKLLASIIYDTSLKIDLFQKDIF